MDIAELDNPPLDYKNVAGMNVACLKENVGIFQELINRILSWFYDLFGTTKNQENNCLNEGNLCCVDGQCSDVPTCEAGKKLVFGGCDEDCEPQYTCEEKSKEILLFVDNSLLPNLQLDMDIWKQDIKNEYNYEIKQKSILDESPEEIKEIIQNEYNSGELTGVMLVGNIPTVLSNLCSGNYCSTDHFYHDLNGDCFSVKNTGEVCDDSGCSQRDYYALIDGDKCRNFKEKSPRFWVARLLTPDSGGNNFAALSSYFKRNHQYRVREKSYEHKMLAYLPILESDFPEEAEEKRQLFLNQNFMEPSESSEYYSGDINLIADPRDYGDVSEKYAEELSKSYEQVFYNGHGSALLQQGMTSTYLDGIKPNPLFYSLMSCSVGDFTTDDYLAGKYLFNGDGLMVLAATYPIFVVNQFPQTQSFMLDNGFSFDYLYTSNFALHLLGDPTLKLSERTDTKIEIEDVDLGKLRIPENNIFEKRFNVTYKNLGNKKINILFKEKSDYEIGQYIEGVPPSFLFSLEPKEVKTFSSTMYVLDSSKPQKFNVIYSFYTNSKEPIKSFEISGEITNPLSLPNEQDNVILGKECTTNADCPTQFTDWICKNTTTTQRFAEYYSCRQGICGSSPGGVEYKNCASGCLNGVCN